MNPGSERLARREAEARLSGCLRHPDGTSARQLRLRAGRSAAAIWARFHVGIHRWRLKHVRWLMQVHLADASPHTRYQMWLAVRSLLRVTGRARFEHELRGPWVRPTGEPGSIRSGRPSRIAGVPASLPLPRSESSHDVPS
jgi:hypothetical protein